MLHESFAVDQERKREIHIHIIHPHQIDNKKYNYLLDAFEQQKSQSFAFDKDRTLYGASHIFLRQMLSRYESLNSEDWLFSHDTFGKPKISNAGYIDLKFNLSHTHSMIACAISYGNELGVDIERHRSLNNFTGMCCLVLCEQEQKYLLSIDRQKQKNLFFRYWTLKEACVKALGKGLTIPLHSIQYKHASHGKWQCTVDSSLKAPNLHSFYYDLPQKPYSLALTAQLKSGKAIPTIRLFDWQQEQLNPQCFTFNVLPG